MRRPYQLALLAAGLILFLAISGMLARAFSIDSAERSAITAVVQAEARGDLAGVMSRVNGCELSAACRARVAADVAALRHPGTVSILKLDTSSGFSLAGSTGTARVAWAVGSSLPRVQCLRVRRAGNVLSGLRIELLELSLRLPRADADCPARY